jgi:hypothetical protein
MQLVRIAGPTEQMRRLGEVAGLHFERTSATRLQDDAWRVSGYASDEALEELRGRGLSIELVVEADQLSEQRATLFASITRPDRGGDAGPQSA